MGIPIPPPIVHEEVAKTSFRANGPAAVILEVVSALSTLLLPLLVGFSLGHFWIQLNSFSIPPYCEYTGKAMAKATAYDGSEYLWASSGRLQTALQGDVRSMRPFVSHYSDDRDRDGLPDVHYFDFAIPLRTDSGIASFEFLPAFDYRFKNDILDLDMETAPLISLRAPAGAATEGGSKLVADGSLEFRQSQTLSSSRWVRYDVIYRRSYFDSVRDVSDIVNMGELAQQYNHRNETAAFEVATAFAATKIGDAVDIQHGPATLNDVCTVSLVMRVPHARVDYSPSFGEALKHGWVQYFCIAYIFWWAFGIVKGIFVSQALVNTIAEVRGRP